MMNDKLTLLIDIDDVLWELMPTWCEEYNRQYFANLKPSQFKTWDISEAFDDDNQVVEFYSLLSRPVFWDKVLANQDYKTILLTAKLLKKLTMLYNVYIVSATEYYMTYKLDLFLNTFDFINPDNLLLVKDKWLLNADIIIDDNADNLEQFDFSARKIKINKPWNEHFDCENYNHFNDAAITLIEEEV